MMRISAPAGTLHDQNETPRTGNSTGTGGLLYGLLIPYGCYTVRPSPLFLNGIVLWRIVLWRIVLRRFVFRVRPKAFSRIHAPAVTPEISVLPHDGELH